MYVCVCVWGGGEFFEPGNPKGGKLKQFWKSGERGRRRSKIIFVPDCWEAVNFVWNNQFAALQFDA